MNRKPYVAGKFYPLDVNELGDALNSYIDRVDNPVKIPAIIVPHAGYVYSGKTAGALYSKIQIPQTVVIIGSNHTGAGKPIAVYPEGNWETPLGTVVVDSATAKKICELSEYASADTTAHSCEHSIEVQVPFLQLLNPNVEIVPIAMGNYSIEAIEDLANAINKATDGKDVLFVASSDFSHYEPEYTAKARDKMAINAIKDMDWRGLHEITHKNELSLCGLGPIAVIIELAKSRGASAGKLISYSNSGELSHDFSNVVTYASIAFK